MPRPAEEQIGVQDEAVVPHDVELPAMVLDQLDHPSRRRHRAVETRCFEAQHSLAD
jgi:hypothetical protein